MADQSGRSTVSGPVTLPRRAWRIAAFAQADLLLVLAGLLLLLAILVPMISKSRERSRLVQCTDNLGQITKAILKYADEHDRKLPVTKPVPPPGGWWSYKEEVKRYAGLSGPPSTADRLFACPSDRGYTSSPERITPFNRSAKHSFSSYVFNGVTLPGIPNVSGRELRSIRQPERTLLVMEWTAHGPLSWHDSRTGSDNYPFYDGAKNVVGFVDGHVNFIPFHYDGINAAYTRDPVPGYLYKYSGD